jgi:endonuclease G
MEPPLVTEHLGVGKPERWETYLERRGFVELHDNLRKVPAWCMYRMLPGYASEKPRLPGRAFRADPDLPVSGRAELADYRRSGFDRGHMVPSHDMRRTKPIQRECFYLSNIVPQNSKLNQGYWRELEEQTREWYRRSEETFIQVGPIFGLGDGAQVRTVGRGRVVVPVGLWKIVACKKRGHWHAIGFVCVNDHDAGDASEWITRISDIELLTGFRFLTGLPEADQSRLKHALPESLDDW